MSVFEPVQKSNKPDETLFPSAGRVLPEVLQHLRAGDGVRRLVLPGVHAALHPDAEQVLLPADAAQRHRRGRHPPVLRQPHRGLRVGGGEIRRLREQLPGEGGPGPPSPAGSAHLLRDAAGPPLPGPADARPDGAPLHAGVRPPAALPLRRHGALLAAGVPRRERAGRQAGVHQHPRQLLVGRHLHDDGGLRRHGAPEHPGPGGGVQQHPERHPPHGVPRHLHLSHLLEVVPGAEGGADPGAEAEAGLAGQHQVPEQRGLAGDGRLPRRGRRHVGAAEEVHGRSQGRGD